MRWICERRSAGFAWTVLAGAAALLLAKTDRAVAAGDADLDAPISTAAFLADPGSGQGGATKGAPENPYAHLGDNPAERFWRYQALEIGQSSAPVDPTAPPPPPPFREGWPPPPETTPPIPFYDWPHGATTPMGTTRTASVDSPLMVALAPTALGQALNSVGIQIYGWVNFGGNLSTSQAPGGNAPAGYDFTPNVVQLDQTVLYIERLPDTVQTDHIDYGFRLSGMYGENYRYTTAYGLASYQLLKKNDFYGYDFPMVYGEVYIPGPLQGLMLRIGRFISVPDIEAQLAPNNYMYTHSISYTFDNFTNEGLQATLAITRQFMLQLAVTDGTESAVWQVGQKLRNLFPNTPADLAIANAFLTANNLPTVTNANPLYPGATYLKNPGATPSATACARYQTLTANTDIYLCADAINHGQYGYNNLQWYGFTFYHKFRKDFEVSFETYNEHEDGVPNANNPLVADVIIPEGGEPFSPQRVPFNAPDPALCKSHVVFRCKSSSQGALAYWNWTPNPLNNVTLRTEYYDDMEGQRTGFVAVYYDFGLSLQHWFSPQLEIRPEVTYYHASEPAFDLGTRKDQTVVAGDLIAHF
jgi:hypothetical protein